MITETIYTSIGAAALAVDFVTSPKRRQDWMRKAERRGLKATEGGRQALRPVTVPVVRTIQPLSRSLETTIADVRRSSLALIRVGEGRTARATAAAVRRVRNVNSRPAAARTTRTTRPAAKPRAKRRAAHVTTHSTPATKAS